MRYDDEEVLPHPECYQPYMFQHRIRYALRIFQVDEIIIDYSSNIPSSLPLLQTSSDEKEQQPKPPAAYQNPFS
jgi:hypothetical protein